MSTTYRARLTVRLSCLHFWIISVTQIKMRWHRPLNNEPVDCRDDHVSCWSCLSQIVAITERTVSFNVDLLSLCNAARYNIDRLTYHQHRKSKFRLSINLSNKKHIYVDTQISTIKTAGLVNDVVSALERQCGQSLNDLSLNTVVEVSVQQSRVVT